MRMARRGRLALAVLETSDQDEPLPIIEPADDDAVGGAGVWWDRTLFRTNETPDNACPEAIDITGQRRVLVFGPWRRLEPGLWRASVSFELCDEAARRRLWAEFGSIAGFSNAEAPRGVAGRHELEITRAISAEEKVEIRIATLTAAFHGSLRFHGVRLHKLTEAEPQTAQP